MPYERGPGPRAIAVATAALAATTFGLVACSNDGEKATDTTIRDNTSLTTDMADNTTVDTENDNGPDDQTPTAPDVTDYQMGDEVKLGDVEGGDYATIVLRQVTGAVDDSDTAELSDVRIDAQGTSTADIQLTAALTCENAVSTGGGPLSSGGGTDWPVAGSGGLLEMTASTNVRTPLIVKVPKDCVNPSFELAVSQVNGELAGDFQAARWKLDIPAS